MKIKRNKDGGGANGRIECGFARALAILKAAHREEGNPHVFISRTKTGSGLSNMAMLDLLQRTTWAMQRRRRRCMASGPRPNMGSGSHQLP